SKMLNSSDQTPSTPSSPRIAFRKKNLGVPGVLGVEALLLAAACSSGTHAYVGQVKSRSELVGGMRAIGDVGDWRLSNGRVRFIVQDKGASRVYTTFGGSLIDADLERSAELDPKGRPE